MRGLDEYCAKHYGLRPFELTRAFDAFIQATGYWLSEGYRIDTPIGSFAPRLRVIWHESVEKWLEGFRRVQNTNTQEVLADQEKLEAKLHECLERYHGYVTVRLFSIHTGLTYYSAKKQLNQWTLGQQAKLLKTKRGQEYIYTEI